MEWFICMCSSNVVKYRDAREINGFIIIMKLSWRKDELEPQAGWLALKSLVKKQFCLVSWERELNALSEILESLGI